MTKIWIKKIYKINQIIKKTTDITKLDELYRKRQVLKNALTRVGG
jgi:hypothetical protein